MPDPNLPADAKGLYRSSSNGSITHLGITYTITQSAHLSETPVETCQACGGSGQLYTRECRDCKGRGQFAHREAESSAGHHTQKAAKNK